MRQRETAQLPPTDVEEISWLTSAAAAAWLAEAARTDRTLASNIAHLRGELTVRQTHLVMEQAELRRRAAAKFTAGAEMFFTARGLEQSTDQWVAAYKAARFPQSATVFDLCCGIGGDLLALARRGPVRGWDRDAAMAMLAQANLRTIAGSAASADPEPPSAVEVGDVREVDVGSCAAWHLDPDRRVGENRTSQIEFGEPPLEVIESLLVQNSSAAIKLAPAAEVPFAWQERAELEWIGRDRQCRQLVAWFGRLSQHAAKRRATMLGREGAVARTFVGTPGQCADVAGELRRYLYEPDAAVLAADLAGALAAQHGLLAIAPGAAYLTSELLIEDAALACFEVQEVLPFRIKPLKQLLRSRDIGILEIKKRGVEHNPADVRRQLALSGEHSATLILTRIGKQALAVVAQRVGPGATDD